MTLSLIRVILFIDVSFKGTNEQVQEGSDGSGSKFFDPGRVGSIFLLGLGHPFMVWV